jgi:hypothetical protein
VNTKTKLIELFHSVFHSCGKDKSAPGVAKIRQFLATLCESECQGFAGPRVIFFSTTREKLTHAIHRIQQKKDILIILLKLEFSQ